MYVCQGKIIGTCGKYWSKWHLWILIICKSGKMVLKVRFWGNLPKLSESLTCSKTGKGESVHLLRNKNKQCPAIYFYLYTSFCEKGTIFNTFLGVVVSCIFECLWHSEKREVFHKKTCCQLINSATNWPCCHIIHLQCQDSASLCHKISASQIPLPIQLQP